MDESGSVTRVIKYRSNSIGTQIELAYRYPLSVLNLARFCLVAVLQSTLGVYSDMRIQIRIVLEFW